jgi:RNA polymerase sigma-70 factor (ECF subfamily)
MLENNENFMMERIFADDPSAFHTLYVKYHIRIRMLVSHHIDHEQDIDDVVQIIFLNAFQWFKGCRNDSEFCSRLYSIAMNSIKKYYRHEAGFESGADYSIDGVNNAFAALDIFNENNPEGICSAMETGLEIARIISELPPLLKEALLLRENDGMRYDEIAIRMGCPTGTVRSRIHRVRADIRKRVETDV